MRRRQQRHPALDAAVFAAALLLSAFIARELWLRRTPVMLEPAALRPVVLNPGLPPLPVAATGHRTEVGVNGVAPIKLTRVQRRASKSAAVPAP